MELCDILHSFLAETNEGPGGDGQPPNCQGSGAESTQCQVHQERKKRESERERERPEVSVNYTHRAILRT